jgi:hypothetical protein
MKIYAVSYTKTVSYSNCREHSKLEGQTDFVAAKSIEQAISKTKKAVLKQTERFFGEEKEWVTMKTIYVQTVSAKLELTVDHV